ncbi:MAG: protein phosphatase 2C domain-containing protein, partial [Defluviitaleaceae bacterium]|nr:protein phosphatase 2C domain-containing protein [Defluviitaleaceae bacterium]
MVIKSYALSDIGKQRETNQDSFGIKTIDNLHFFIVADGMGGHSGGEVASNLSIESFFKYIEKVKQ